MPDTGRSVHSGLMNSRLVPLSESQYRLLGGLISGHYGIKLPPEKRILFQSRMQSRLRELGMDSFDRYALFVSDPSNKKGELAHMIDRIATNKTAFFREARHFEYVRSAVLPDIRARSSSGDACVIKCWCAGCSTGEEVYSLAMSLDAYKQRFGGFVDYTVMGSDVSGKVLPVAREGIYPYSQSASIPASYLKPYVLRSRDRKNPRIRIVQSLRSKVLFLYCNLMDEKSLPAGIFHLIFIRNTLIYFSRENQRKILSCLLDRLKPEGYLFIGNAESLIGFDIPLNLVAPGVYKKVSYESKGN